MSEQPISRPFKVAAIAVLLSATFLLAVSVYAFDVAISGYVLVIALLAAASERYAPVLSGYSASLAFPLLMSALVIGGPLDGAVVAGASVLTPDLARSKKGFVTSIYNLGQTVTAAVLAGWLYLSLGGSPVPWSTHVFPAILFPLAAAAIVCAGVNIIFTALGVVLLYGEPMRPTILSTLRYAPSLLSLAAVGFLMGHTMAVNIFALPLFIYPLWVAKQLYQSFVQLNQAYTDTIRSLVNAVEAKDAYTSGHSQRVSEYAVRLGRHLRLPEPRLCQLEHAALLHDLGKLSLGGELLRKTSPLSSTEREQINQHPAVGARMISRIPPLSELSEAIGQHHERPDGSGYPKGLEGSAICLDARILAVADSYDAMTTNRPYRDGLSRTEAVAELRRNSGTQFDAKLVELFAEHVAKQEEPSAGVVVDTLSESVREANRAEVVTQ